MPHYVDQWVITQAMCGIINDNLISDYLNRNTIVVCLTLPSLKS